MTTTIRPRTFGLNPFRIAAWLPWALVLLVGLCVPAGGRAEEPGPRRPNVVLILADDLGFSDLGCYGGEIETPHLDRLAAEGMRFSQFYNCAVCRTSRVSLLTAQHPDRVSKMEADWLQWAAQTGAPLQGTGL